MLYSFIIIILINDQFSLHVPYPNVHLTENRSNYTLIVLICFAKHIHFGGNIIAEDVREVGYIKQRTLTRRLRITASLTCC